MDQTEPPYAYDRQLYVVSIGNKRFVTWAFGREDAKRKAHGYFGGNPDTYVLSPISEPGDQVHIELTLAI